MVNHAEEHCDLSIPMKLFRILFATAAIYSTLFIPTGQSQDVSTLIRKADQLDAQEQTDAAIDTLKQAEKISPNNPDVLIKLSQDYSGKIDAVKDRSEKLHFANLCLEYAKKAVREAPDNSDAHVCLSIAYGKMTDFVDNKTKMEYSKVVNSEAEKALELNPDNDLALLILARWNFEMATLNPILRGVAQALYGQLPPASKEKADRVLPKSHCCCASAHHPSCRVRRGVGIDGQNAGSHSRVVKG